MGCTFRQLIRPSEKRELSWNAKAKISFSLLSILMVSRTSWPAGSRKHHADTFKGSGLFTMEALSLPTIQGYFLGGWGARKS